MQAKIEREFRQDLLLKQSARNSVNSLRENDTMTLVEFGAGGLVSNKLNELSTFIKKIKEDQHNAQIAKY